MTDGADEALSAFRRHDGMLKASEAERLGVHRQTIARLLEAGRLLREERGLYRLADTPPTAHNDLVIVAKLVPRAVICLTSALSFHQLTTQIPRRVHVALPQSTKKPRVDYPPMDFVWLSEVPYSSGIERHQLGAAEVAVYSPAKTVADMFKFRRKVGEDLAIEALRDYLRSDRPDINQLLEYAAVDRVRTIMAPYIKSLL